MTLYAKWAPVTYTITYDLDGGSLSPSPSPEGEGSNPTSYTIESDDITLINPTKEGYVFSGWTGSNGDTPQTNVTITSGSTGNLTFTANCKTFAIYG